MKRFAGFISLGVALLGAAVVGVVPTIRATNGDSSYSFSRNYVYKISDKRETGDLSDGTNNGPLKYDTTKETPLETVSDVFKTRLDEANITNYKLETLADNTISLTFKDSQDNYDDIAEYLTYSNSLMIKDYNEKYTMGHTVKELKYDDTANSSSVFEAGSAKVEYKDNYPYVVMKLADPEGFKTIINGITESTAESDRTGLDFVNPIKKADEAEEETSTKLNKEKVLYLLNSWLDGFTVKSLLDDSNKFIDDTNFSNYVVTYFDPSVQSSFFWDYDSSLTADEQKKQTYEYVYFATYNKGAINSESGVDVKTSYSVYNQKETDSKSAYQKAILFRNKFNSSFLSYDVTIISSNWVQPSQNLVSPFKEYLVRDQRVVFSTVAIAAVVAIALITLFLVLNYGASGVMAGIVSFATLVGSLFFFNFMNNPFNLGTLIGAFGVSMLSLALSMLWLQHTKYELYSGKNLKKAFQEANRKSLFNLLDFSVIGAAIGLTCFLIPNAYVSSFGGILVIGSLLNAVANGIIFKLLEWFLYNSNFAANHLRLFGVDKKLVPNLSRDEKPQYFEQFKRKQHKNAFKIAGITSLVLLAGSVVALTTFQAVNGNIYNTQTTEINTRAIVEFDVLNVSGEYSITQTLVNVENAVNGIYKDENLKTKLLKNPTVSLMYYDYNADEVAKIVNREYYFVIDLGGVVDISETSATTVYTKVDTELISGTFEKVFKSAIGRATDNSGKVTLSKAYSISDDSNNLYVLIATAISSGVLLLYMLFRFGPSKAVAGFAIIASAFVIVPGIFSLTRIVVPSEITLSLLFVELMAFLAIDVLFTGERQAYLDNKHELKELAAREPVYEETNNRFGLFLIITNAFAIFILGSFLLSSSFSRYTILFAVLGLAVVLIMLKFLYLPIEMFLSKRFENIKLKISETGKTKKGKKAKKEFDDGPQEAIFTGIND